LRRLRIARGEGDAAGQLPVQADLERILAWSGEGDVEHQHGAGLDIHYAGGRLAELHGTLSAEELRAGLIHKTDSYGMDADFSAPSPNPKDEVSTWVDRGKIREPDMLEHAENTEFSLLVDKGVIGNN
jgi:hypothetical protein